MCLPMLPDSERRVGTPKGCLYALGFYVIGNAIIIAIGFAVVRILNG